MTLIVKVHIFDDDEGATTLEFTQFPVRIGRDEGCALRVKHPRASRHHARIERVEDGALLVDEGSRNGILHNGVRINPLEPVRLRDCDRLAIGPVTMTVRICGLTELLPVHPTLAAQVKDAASLDGRRPSASEAVNAFSGPTSGTGVALRQAVGRTTQLSDLATDVAFRSPLAAQPPVRALARGSDQASKDRERMTEPRIAEVPATKEPSRQVLSRQSWVTAIFNHVLGRVRQSGRRFVLWLRGRATW